MTRMKRLRKICMTAAAVLVMAAALMLAGCGSQSGAMQISQFVPDEGQKDMYDLAVSGLDESIVMKFDAGTGVKDMAVGYEVYEKGKKVRDDVPQFGLTAEKDSPMKGYLGLWFMGGEGRISTSGAAVSSVTLDAPWKEYEDKDGYSWGSSGGGGDIVKGEKTYIYGHYVMKDDSDMEIVDPVSVMSDKDMLKQYEKAYMFYVIFK